MRKTTRRTAATAWVQGSAKGCLAENFQTTSAGPMREVGSCVHPPGPPRAGKSTSSLTANGGLWAEAGGPQPLSHCTNRPCCGDTGEMPCLDRQLGLDIHYWVWDERSLNPPRVIRKAWTCPGPHFTSRSGEKTLPPCILSLVEGEGWGQRWGGNSWDAMPGPRQASLDRSPAWR